MTDDRISGSAKNIGGQVEEGFGRVTGDEKTQLQGKAKQAEGTLQDVYGQAKETAADAAEAIRERASEAGDFLRTTIEERPFTAAAIALAIGFLIGRFGHRSTTRAEGEANCAIRELCARACTPRGPQALRHKCAWFNENE